MRTLLLFILVFLASSAVPQQWVWALTEGSASQRDEQGDMVIDENGYVYQTGYFDGTEIDLGTYTLESDGAAGIRHIFVAKFSPSGSVVWALTNQSGGQCQGIAIDVDQSGNVIVGGSFGGTDLQFGNVGLTGNGSVDLFVVKFNPSGSPLWGLSAGGLYGSASEYVDDICTDVSGNIYFTGYSGSSTLTIGGQVLEDSGANQTFLVKMSPQGSVLWAVNSTSECSHRTFCVEVDAFGNPYLGGWFFNSTLQYGGVSVATAGNGDQDGFLIKFSPQGNAVWGRSIGGVGVDMVNAIGGDEVGNMYIVGTSSSSPAMFGTLSVPSTGHPLSYIAKTNGSGQFQWATLTADSAYAADIAVNADGSSLVCGWFETTAWQAADTTLLNSWDSQGAFVLGVDNAGSVQWATGGQGEQLEATRVVSSSSGAAYLGGTLYFSDGVFAPQTAAQFEDGDTDPDAFLVKLAIPQSGVGVEEPAVPSSQVAARCIITSDQVTLDIPTGAGSTSISVTDGTGAVVREQIITTPGRQQIELAALPVGMYLITVATADGFAAQRVMLVR